MYYGNLGILLNETREEKKLSLEEVSRGCNISKTYIQLIEEGNLYQLPSYTHARSFVRKYAEYLNFNYKKDIEYLFDSECQRNIFDNKNIVNNSTGTPHAVASRTPKSETTKKPKKKSEHTSNSNEELAPANDTNNIKNNSENVLSYINFKDMPDVSYDHAPPNNNKNNTLLYAVFSGIAVLTVVVIGLALWNKNTSNIDPVFIAPDPIDVVDTTPDIVSQDTPPIPYNYLATSSLGLTPTLNTYYIALITSDIANGSMNQFRSLPIDDTTTPPPNITYADAIPNDNILSLVDPNKTQTAYVEFTGESWVHIESDTGEIIEVTGENGITLPFEFQTQFTITIGNIGGASIHYNGKRITSFGNEGEILRNKIFTLNQATGEFDITTKPR